MFSGQSRICIQVIQNTQIKLHKKERKNHTQTFIKKLRTRSHNISDDARVLHLNTSYANLADIGDKYLLYFMSYILETLHIISTELLT